MALVRYTARPPRDLLDIWLDIASDNLEAADRVYLRLEERLKILERFPEAGGEPGYRQRRQSSG